MMASLVIQQISKKGVSLKRNAKPTLTAQKALSAKSTSMVGELVLIPARSCLVQILKDAQLLMAVHSALARKAMPRINLLVFVKLLLDAQVMLNVDQVKCAEKDNLEPEPALMFATQSSAQQTQSVLLTITKEPASVMLDSVDHLTAEMDACLPAKDVQMMPNVKKMKCVESLEV